MSLLDRVDDQVEPAHKIVVAGPSSALTLPGVVVSQIANVLSDRNEMTRIEVNAGYDFDADLNRVVSLAAVHDESRLLDIVSLRAPETPRLRARAFREWVSGSDLAIAFVWPGLELGWLRQFFQAARADNVPSVALCMSLPHSTRAHLFAARGNLTRADVVVVGAATDAADLRVQLGPDAPVIKVHPALSLLGRDGASPEEPQRITAFLPRDDGSTLEVLLSAFDAIPDAWISRYRLNVVMRSKEAPVADLVSRSHHAQYVSVTDGTLTADTIRELCHASSALIIAEPAFNSRAFAIATECGIATVVLTSTGLPQVGRGYVGGLLADQSMPVSVHVALHHALRLSELQFPQPEQWHDLVAMLTTEAARLATSEGGLAASSSLR